MLKFFFLLVSLSLINGANAQKYNFKNFSVGDGLTQSEIYSICEDRRGTLWFGSLGGGIIKYDGYTFTNYREEDGLSNNFVRAIYEDKSGKIWIGTEGGLCCYDGIKFKRMNQAGGPGKNMVRAIKQDASGNLWFGTDQDGLFKYDGKSFTHYLKQTGLPDNTVYCIFEDKGNTVWIGTNQGVCKLQDSRFITYTKNNGLPSNIIRGITDDESGNLWFATYGGGISSYNGTTFTNYNSENGICNNSVFTIFTDRKGRIWIGTANGVSCYNGSTFKNYYDSNGLASNVVVCIYEDSSQDIWFGTSGGGLSRFDNERFTHYVENEKMGRQVYTLIQAHNNNMIFGTSNGGLTIFDGKYYSLVKGSSNFTSDKVRTLNYDQDSTLWIGTIGDGAFKFNRQGFTHYTLADGLPSTNISAIVIDATKNIWFASSDSGISILDKQTGKFQKFTENNGLLNNSIYAMVPDHAGNIWIGTDKGLQKITPGADTLPPAITSFTQTSGLSNNAIRSIAVDKSNNIIIGTAGGGINVLQGTKFITINKSQGLCSNNIYLLIFDDFDNLWVGTELGIDRITFGRDFSIEEYRHYGKNEGFAGIEVYRNACFKDKNGNLWFGTVNGATIYKEKEDEILKTAPKIQLTGIKLFFDNIEKTKYVDSVSAWFPIPHNLKLPYNKNNLTFEFAGIYHRNPEAVRYKYKLEGSNDDWSPALTQHKVTYSNLPPGKYIFKMMACNEYNVWNKDPLTFEFQILPPFWQRWWFIGLSALICIFTVWSVFQYIIQQIKTKNQAEREKLLMEKNIVELEQEAARLQMNPHFIFNSLNSIQGFIATNDTFQAKRYLAKFARLMRLILENAREEFIPLRNETDMLENYLELEKLSKNNIFDFKINTCESINYETTEIPPMMIQPFVENAIIHGIKNKEGKGFIEINFRFNDSLMICEVIDNGIGRQKSAEIKEKTNAKHKSTGMMVTRKRLEQFKIQTGSNAGVEIVDLKDENNNPVGTKVIVSIPFEAD